MTFINKIDVGKSLQLTELKSLFDHMMQDGYTFEEVKKVHIEIKKLEAEINYKNRKKDKSYWRRHPALCRVFNVFF